MSTDSSNNNQQQQVKSVSLLKPIDFKVRVTTWPFLPLYALVIGCIADPVTVYGAEIYEDWASFIDFSNAVALPLVGVFHVFVFLLTKWLPKLRARTDFSTATNETATHVLVDVFEHRGLPGIVPVEFDSGLGCKIFYFQQTKFYLSSTTGQFVRPKYPDDKTLAYYNELGASTIPTTQDSLVSRRNLFGSNAVESAIPTFVDLLADHMMAPFFVFQIFCVLLWCLDEYWMVALLNGFMMVGLECTVVMQRIRQMKTMRDMGSVPVSEIYVRRGVFNNSNNNKSSSASSSSALSLSVSTAAFIPIKSSELLPDDVVLVTGGVSVPADMILVKGTCVLNEATLTGESTPQLKQAISAAQADSEKQYTDAKFSSNTIFSGTQVLSSGGHSSPVPSSSSSLSTNNNKQNTQRSSGTQNQEGALAVVIRTGFDTKQGQLMRTIAHSQSRVSQNSGEAFGFIGLLLIFACIASAYVLRRGLVDPTKSRWKLFLTCTQIITSVVPPELPMQLTLAVNTSLVALMKLRVFCTEPFRIPFAGKVNVCCFDKTGTLTTDEMLYAGVDDHLSPPSSSSVSSSGSGPDSPGTHLHQSYLKDISTTPSGKADIVIGSCHSLVALDDGKSAGDAMEKASADAIGWKVTKGDESSRIYPQTGRKITIRTQHRFAFDPVLRRMSCVVSVSGCNQDDLNGTFVVSKGSPESILSMLSNNDDSSFEKQYFSKAHSHTARGMRVIALAIRKVDKRKENINTLTRERSQAESNLEFCGFALFDCPLKKDAGDTISQLTNGSHHCIMITGDSCRTAIVVGKKVQMIKAEEKVFLARCSPCSSENNNNKKNNINIMWYPLDDETLEPIESQAIPRLQDYKGGASGVVGCVDGDELSDEAFAHLLTLPELSRIAIWSRCPPTHKEEIVCALKEHCDATVLMAGDGTNDVGGLKQAHVGIAVLNSSSFQAEQQNNDDKTNANAVTAATTNTNDKTNTNNNDPSLPKPPPALPPNAGIMDTIKHTYARAQYEATMKQRQMQDQAKQNQKGIQEQQKQKADQALEKVKSEKNLSSTEAASAMTSMFNEMEDENEAPMVKLGDASIAAPFTCKSRKLTSVCDIVRLGRCTLVTTIQMYKIIALNCLVSAYTMAVLFTDGVKFSQTQMVSSGIVLAICFLLLSNSKPLDELSKQRPITRVFHPANLVSIFGQFAIHLYSLSQSVELVQGHDPEGVASQKGDDEEVDFKPSLLNSIVFLMTTLMSVTTFTVNYRGRPFMTGLTDNKVMLGLLGILAGLVFYCAAEYDLEFNAEFEITKFPSEQFRTRFIYLLGIDAVGTFLVEFVSNLLFAPK